MAADVLQSESYVPAAMHGLTGRTGSSSPTQLKDCFSTHVGRRHRRLGSGTSWLPVMPCVRIGSTLPPTSRSSTGPSKPETKPDSGGTARMGCSIMMQDCV